MSEGNISPESSEIPTEGRDNRTPFSQKERQIADQEGAKHVSKVIKAKLDEQFKGPDQRTEKEKQEQGGVNSIKVGSIYTKEELEERARQQVGGELTEENILKKAKEPHEINIPAEAITNLLQAIPENKNWEQFLEFVLVRTERAEDFNEWTPETIKQFIRAISNYEFVGGEPNPNVLNDLVRLVEIRGTLSYANFNINNYNYKENVGILSEYLDDEHLTLLWELEVEDEEKRTKIIQNLIDDMEADNGAYWRKNKEEKDAFIDGNRIQTLFADFDTNQRKKQVEAARGIVERLFHITGMSAFYAGPIDTQGNLVDLQIMRQTDDLSSRESRRVTAVDAAIIKDIADKPDDYPDTVYMKNEIYWDLWWEKRLKGESKMSGRDPSGGMRRVFYIPEELGRLGNTKAESLRYACEGYARTLPQLNGNKTLREYMEKAATYKQPRGGTKANMYAYASSIAGAGEVVGMMNNLTIEPIKGGENAGDLSKLGDNLKNLTDIIGAFSQYLQRGTSRNILYYGTSRIMESTFKWVNSKSREKEFKLLPRFKKKIMNTIFHASALEQFMNDARRGWALRGVGASDERIIAILTKEAFGGWFRDILQILTQAIISGK